MADKIQCRLCEGETHSIVRHLADKHSGTTVQDYTDRFPDAPLESPAFILAKQQRGIGQPRTEVHAMAGSATNVVSMAAAAHKGTPVKKIFHEVFGLEPKGEALSVTKKPIQITCIEGPHDQQDYVPKVHDEYVFDPEDTKDLIVALELNMPSYVYGHKGAGKSELYEQVCARTNRPLTRVQHTISTEVSDIVGQWIVKGGETIFQLGPLPLAMLNGHLYLADEYDRGQPTVLSVYQAVLEGKSLVIMNAPPEYRIINPHAMFRFGATGNTNGSGDDTGLYQGAVLQDSANFDRFNMMIHKKYMSPQAESEMLQRRKLVKGDADKLVKFATSVREAYDARQISDTISPRALIAAARIGVARGSFRIGLHRAFINKLTPVDREVVDGLAQRIFT